MSLKTKIANVVLGVSALYWVGLGAKCAVSYDLDQASQAAVTQFGEVVRVDKNPGIHGLVPFINSPQQLTTRVVEYKSKPQVALTQDKKTIEINYFAAYKIVDPKLFLERVRTEEGAHPIIDDLVYSEMRNVIAQKYTFTDVIHSRDKIPGAVKDSIHDRLKQYGIEVIDIQLTTTNPTQGQVIDSIQARMKAERDQIAQGFLSEGEADKTKTIATADREAVTIRSEAFKKAETIRGEADREAIRIIQEAYSNNPDLAFLVQWLQALREVVDENDTLIISTESEAFQYLQGSRLVPAQTLESKVGE